jgi:CubicO group peptidase (beta-lactamase class C family)
MTKTRIVSPLPAGRALAAGVLLAFAAGGAAADPSTPPNPGPMAALLGPMVGTNLAGAVVAVANRDRILALEAVGYADLEARRPMAADTVFWIASETKAMTAAALMMLVDEGRVRVDDPVERFLPEFKGMRVKVTAADGHSTLVAADHPILVREILSHSSGLAFSSPIEVPTLDVGTLEQRVRSYAQAPLNSQPGTTFAYSNEGINTAGRIIEVVGGLPYEAFMSRRLFDPLGMTDTTFYPSRAQLDRLATSYGESADQTKLVRITIDQLASPLDGPGRYPIPAGGLFSTARDEVKFCQMLLNGGTAAGVRYLSGEAVREMTRRQDPADAKFPYGFGWNTSAAGYFHSGAYGTNVQVEPAEGMIAVYMVQQSHGKYPNTARDIPALVNDAARQLVRRAR